MSNGKKLGVKSKVSDNYLVTGNDYEKFQEALHDMDNRTVIIPVRNPESMRIHCVIAKSDKEHQIMVIIVAVQTKIVPTLETIVSLPTIFPPLRRFQTTKMALRQCREYVMTLWMGA